MSRPDYFEHPILDMYGRVVQEGADPVTGYMPETEDYLTETNGELDEVMGGDSVLDY